MEEREGKERTIPDASALKEQTPSGDLDGLCDDVLGVVLGFFCSPDLLLLVCPVCRRLLELARQPFLHGTLRLGLGDAEDPVRPLCDAVAATARAVILSKHGGLETRYCATR